MKPIFTYSLLISICLLILAAFLRFPFINIPMERDEAFYLLAGKQLTLGQTPYIDFFDNRLPGAFAAYAGVVTCFGSSITSSGVGFLVINAITTLTIYLIGKQLFTERAGWMAGVSFAILSLIPPISGFSRQSEHLVNFFAVVGVYSLYRGLLTSRRVGLLIGGLLLGMATLIKHNAVFFALWGFAPIIFVWVYHQQKSTLWHLIGYYTFGGLLITVMLLGWPLWMGAGDKLWYWAFQHSGLYASQIPFVYGKLFAQTAVKNIADFAGPFLWLASGGLLLLLVSKYERSIKYSFLLYVVASCFAIIPGLHFFGHYFLMFMPAMSLLVGIFFDTLCQFFQERFRRLHWLPLASFILFITLFLYNHRDYYFRPDYTAILKKTYGQNAFPEAVVISGFIRQHSQPGDYLGTLGSEQELFIYTDLLPASRHTFMYPLMIDTLLTPRSIQFQREFIEEASRHKPRFFVYFRQGDSIGKTEKSSKLIFNWFDAYMLRYYHKVGLIEIGTNHTTRYTWGQKALRAESAVDDLIFIYEKNDVEKKTSKSLGQLFDNTSLDTAPAKL